MSRDIRDLLHNIKIPNFERTVGSCVELVTNRVHVVDLVLMGIIDCRSFGPLGLWDGWHLSPRWGFSWLDSWDTLMLSTKDTWDLVVNLVYFTPTFGCHEFRLFPVKRTSLSICQSIKHIFVLWYTKSTLIAPGPSSKFRAQSFPWARVGPLQSVFILLFEFYGLIVFFGELMNLHIFIFLSWETHIFIRGCVLRNGVESAHVLHFLWAALLLRTAFVPVILMPALISKLVLLEIFVRFELISTLCKTLAPSSWLYHTLVLYMALICQRGWYVISEIDISTHFVC